MNGLLRKTTAIQGRLAWVFGALLLLAVLSALLMNEGLVAERQDATVINLAGRQRMLIQQIARLSAEYEQEGEDHYRSDLLAAIADFDRTLRALRSGGSLVDYRGQTLLLPPQADQRILTELDGLEAAWRDFRTSTDRLLATRTGAQEVAAASQGILGRADRVVQAFEAAALARVTRLRWLQLGFLMGGLALSGLGWWVLQTSVVRPIRQAQRAAQRIGQGDLESPVAVSGPVELRDLGTEMERTRLQLLASRRELRAWVDTLEHRVRQRTSELEALATVSSEITSHLDIQTVLGSVVEKAQHLIGSEVAELCLLDARRERLQLQAAAGPEAALAQNSSDVGEQAACLLSEASAAGACDAGTCPGFCQILKPSYRASHLATSLRCGDRVIGALCVGSTQKGAFRPDASALLTQLGGVAAVALTNSRLYEQSENAATLLERQRIASEMHDGLLQTLNVLRLLARLAEEQIASGDLDHARAALQKIEQAHAQAETEIRQAITSLQEDFPVHMTLQEQLAAVAAECSPPGHPVEVTASISVPLVLPRQESEQVLRVEREALLNALHYSRAQHVRVHLDRDDHQFLVVVTDDGIGFDSDCAHFDDRPHFGLKIMAARASRIGGTVQVESASGRGTQVTLRWPRKEQSADE